MARFVVMEPADALAGDAAAQARFVRDGFSVLGFLFPPVWLLWHGLLIEAAVTFAAMFCIAAATELLGLGPAGSLLSLLLSFYVGLEGSALRLAALRRRGWQEWGVLDADSLADAETRYAIAVFGEVDADAPALPTAVIAPAQPLARRHAAPPALGLFSYPGHK
jgi:hypothetical protein